MAILIDTRCGPAASTDGPGDQPLRQGRTSELAVVDAHARYAEASSRAALWMAANSAVQALSLNSTATATGLILSNPAGSGRNIIIVEICVSIAAAITAVADIVLCANVNPVAVATVHTTPLIVRNALLGASGTAVGLVDSAATLPAVPVIVRPLLGWHWVTAGTTACGLFVRDEVAGALAIQPGCSVSLAAVTVAHSVLASITWEEMPI